MTDQPPDSKKIKESVSAVDDFIQEYCKTYDYTVEDKLRSLSKWVGKLATETEVLMSTRLTIVQHVKNFIIGLDKNNVFIEIDTPEAKVFAQTLAILKNKITFSLRGTHRAFLWEDHGRVVFTISMTDDEFCARMDEEIQRIKALVATARVLHS